MLMNMLGIWTQAALEKQVIVAATKGNCQVVERVIKQGIDLKSSQVHTALVEACSRGHVDIVKLLINNGVPIKLTDHLLRCIENHDTNMIKLLLTTTTDGLNDEIIHSGMASTFTRYLNVACIYSELETVQTLLEFKANPNLPGIHALHTTSFTLRLDESFLLLCHGANPLHLYQGFRDKYLKLNGTGFNRWLYLEKNGVDLRKVHALDCHGFQMAKQRLTLNLTELFNINLVNIVIDYLASYTD